MEEDQIINRLIWKCGLCNDTVISYSHLRHSINYCDCGETGVDHEEYYTRISGDNFELLSERELIDGKWRQKDGE